MNRLAISLAAVMALSGVAEHVAAADSVRVHFQNATGICQPSLPVFDGNIRKRPLALANEGAAVAFVSCSLPRAPGMGFANPLTTYGISSVTVRLYNRTGAAADVGCTLVSGWDAASSIYSSKVATVPANGNVMATWTAADNDDENIIQPNFNCSLPPGLDIGYFFYLYVADVGD